eukprot:COSAG02_NODE_609_length_19574_cov_18.178537_10_plen_335_part_00
MDRKKRDEIITAIREGDEDKLGAYLHEGGDPNLRHPGNGCPALYIAVCCGQLRQLELLLDAGANLEGKDKYGLTALHQAAARGHLDVVRALLRRGADAAARTKNGKTALELAEKRGHAAVAQALRAPPPAPVQPPAPAPPEPQAEEAEPPEVYQPSKWSGRALILSVQKRRENGASAEQQAAAEALRALGYRVDVRVDPTKAQFEQSVRDWRDADWSNFGSSVVCVMAHGSMRSGVQKVTASDEQEVDLQELYGLLAATSCPGLRGKPKIWIVQACRVGGAALVADDAAETDAGPVLTRNHDFLLTYATMPGNVAYRGGECLVPAVSLGVAWRI